MMFDSDDESESQMTRLSEVVGGAAGCGAAEEAESSDGEVGEVELLQLRNLVQQIKLQTVVGANFMRNEELEQGNLLDKIVTPTSEEDEDIEYKELQRQHCELLGEREQLVEDKEKLATRVRQLEQQLEAGVGGEQEQRLKEAEEKTKKALREVENLKNCHKQLRVYYQGKTNVKGEEQKRDDETVPLDLYNKLVEMNFELNLECAKKDKKIANCEEDLADARSQLQNNSFLRTGLLGNIMNNSSGYGYNTSPGLLGTSPGLLGSPNWLNWHTSNSPQDPFFRDHRR